MEYHQKNPKQRNKETNKKRNTKEKNQCRHGDTRKQRIKRLSGECDRNPFYVLDFLSNCATHFFE